MYHVSAQGVDERIINVRYYYITRKNTEQEKTNKTKTMLTLTTPTTACEEPDNEKQYATWAQFYTYGYTYVQTSSL